MEDQNSNTSLRAMITSFVVSSLILYLFEHFNRVTNFTFEHNFYTITYGYCSDTAILKSAIR